MGKIHMLRMPWNNNSRAFNMREYAIIKMMGIRQIIIN